MDLPMCMLTLDGPDGLLVELESILEPLRVDRLFPHAQPLEVELGSGDASFLVEYARQHPNTNYLGIERLMGRLRKLDRKGRRASLTNLRGLRIESSYFLRYLLPTESCQALHVYFPDPWVKRKQRKHRLVNESFPELARCVLSVGGRVYLRTDDPEYFTQMQEVFQAAPSFRPVETPPDLQRLVTDFEREFNAQGIPTLRAAYERNR